MTFSEPQITIDKAEYDYLKDRIKQLEESDELLLYNAYRGMLTALLSETGKIPGFSYVRYLKMVADALNNEGQKIKDIEIEEDDEDQFGWVYLNISMEGKKGKITFNEG